MTTTHHLDQSAVDIGGGLSDDGYFLDYANAEYRKIQAGEPIPLDVQIAAEIGLGLELRRHSAVMAEFIAEQRRARAISEGLASASLDDDAPVDQTRLEFPLDAEEAERDEATG